MNKRADLTLKELIGLVLFVLALIAVFIPLGIHVWKIFMGVPNEKVAENKIGEIIDKMNFMVDNSIKEENLLLNSPLNWFLVKSEKKLCICKTLAEKNRETQKDICEKYGGFCSDVKYDFIINSYEKISRGDGFMGEGKAIKIEWGNFLVIEKLGNNDFAFRKSSREADLNKILNEFLESSVSYNSKNGEALHGKINYKIKDLVIDICNNKNLGNLFEEQIDSFFNKRLLNGERIRIEIGSSLEEVNSQDNSGIQKGYEYYSFIYPQGYFPDEISTDLSSKFSEKLPATGEDLKEDCVIYLTSTTTDLNLKEVSPYE